jgi:uncharacterized membrane protein
MQPMQPYYQQPQQPMYAQPPAYGQMQARPKQRNVALIVVGGILLVIGALAFLIFAYNAYQYSTVEERFSDISGSAWVVDIIKEADMRRMMIFGPVSAVFGIAGLILGILGLKKK